MLFRKLLRPALRASAAVLLLAAIGCNPAVREDRTITFSSDGKASFQHGKNGVFITDLTTGKPKQIYKPTPDDLAISPPIWDPSGKRMVFAVARSADSKKREVGDTPADGRRFAAVPVTYTCWLHDPSAPAGKLDKLFEATCGHAGCIGAGLAIQWHPDGKHLDYIEQLASNQHQIRSFDLTTRKAEAVPLPPAENIALGSSSGQPIRIALLGGTGSQSGLWIENATTKTWWRVPDSDPGKGHLEELRQKLPKWSRDGTKLAFADGPILRVCDITTQKTESWYQAQSSEKPTTETAFLVSSQPMLADLNWHPDGKRVGLVEDSHLVLIERTGSAKKLSDATVVSFAGWDAKGKRMAYVSLEPLPHAGAPWATLFIPNVHARSAVWMTDANGETPGKKVVSGVRATFPHWSQADQRLSVWLTVEPPYRLPSGDFVGMPSGDPAAIIDPETEQLDWLPVNGTEQAQIAHIDLRAGRLDGALKRFDEATASLPPDGKADWMFFRAIAFQRAGRADEAKDAWRRFEPPSPVKASREAGGELHPPNMENGILALVLNPNAITSRHRFAAEAFLSLDMASEAIEFFRRELKEAKTDPDRLSAVVVLCQLLLLTEQRTQYAELVADQLIPLANRVIPGAGPNREALNGAVALTLLPLAVTEFSAKFHADLLRRVCEKVSLWPRGNDDVDFVCHLLLRTLGRSLRDQELAGNAERRLTTHPAYARWELKLDKVDLDFLTQVRFVFLLPELMHGTFGN
jgi:tetratricopeptide (TPR) repeat protein